MHASYLVSTQNATAYISCCILAQPIMSKKLFSISRDSERSPNYFHACSIFVCATINDSLNKGGSCLISFIRKTHALSTVPYTLIHNNMLF